MNESPLWQVITVGAIFSLALAYVVMQVGANLRRTLFPSANGKGGCGGCHSCPMQSKASQQIDRAPSGSPLLSISPPEPRRS